jgi:hypothetical protein
VTSVTTLQTVASHCTSFRTPVRILTSGCDFHQQQREATIRDRAPALSQRLSRRAPTEQNRSPAAVSTASELNRAIASEPLFVRWTFIKNFPGFFHNSTTQLLQPRAATIGPACSNPCCKRRAAPAGKSSGRPPAHLSGGQPLCSACCLAIALMVVHVC